MGDTCRGVSPDWQWAPAATSWSSCPGPRPPSRCSGSSPRLQQRDLGRGSSSCDSRRRFVEKATLKFWESLHVDGRRRPGARPAAGAARADAPRSARDHERPVVRPQGQQDRCGGARRPDGRACERRGGIADPREPIEVTHFAHAPRIARACADLRCTRPSVHRPSPWPSPAATPAVTGALVPVARSPSWLSAPHLPPCPPLRPAPHLPPCPSLTRRDVGTPLLHFDPQTGPPWSARCSAGWRPPPTRSVPGGTWRPWRASAGSPISGALCARPPSCGRSEVRDRDG